MRRIAQLALYAQLSARSLTYYWKGIYPVSGRRDIAAFQFEMNETAQEHRRKMNEIHSEMKRLTTHFAQAKYAYFHRILSGETQMPDQDILKLRNQEHQYKKELYDSFLN